MDMLKTSNLSLLAIPAYYVLSVLPHAYALTVATKGHPEQWDNTCPRSVTLKEKIKSQLSPAEYARYERAEACSANLYENLPLFASAIIVGNMAGLKREGWEGLNGFAGAYLGLRIAYTLAYIGIGSSAPSYIRSGLWVASFSLCFRVFAQAAKVLGVKGI
jgi:uncharacterized MAPEG superfamily protein